MLCSKCNKNEANFHYTQVNNGKYSQIHLCTACAQELGYVNSSNGFGFTDILSSFFSDASPRNSQKAVCCENCGTTLAEFKKSGMAGCEKCYDVFSYDAEHILASIQPATTHIADGEAKEEKAEEPSFENPLQKLKSELSLAVKEERYEDAARIRDEIKALESKGGEQ